MNFILVLVSALAPAIMLFFYIRKRDEKRPEPIRELLKAFGVGALSAILAVILALFLEAMSFYTDTYDSFIGALRCSLFGAALPEEVSKFLFFWLVVRKNRYFDERVDGIVYAACVSLGFAALENIFYLFGSDSWVTTGIIRAVISVPGHFFFGVLMGYYYSLVRFKNPSLFNKSMVLVAPILAHTIFNLILMSMTLNPVLSLLLLILFVVFFFSLRKRALNSFKEQLQEDDDEFNALEAANNSETLSAECEAIENVTVEVNDEEHPVSYDAMPITDRESSGIQSKSSEELVEDFILNKYFNENRKG